MAEIRSSAVGLTVMVAIVSRPSCTPACQIAGFVGYIAQASGGFHHKKRGDSEHA